MLSKPPEPPTDGQNPRSKFREKLEQKTLEREKEFLDVSMKKKKKLRYTENYFAVIYSIIYIFVFFSVQYISRTTDICICVYVDKYSSNITKSLVKRMAPIIESQQLHSNRQLRC